MVLCADNCTGKGKALNRVGKLVDVRRSPNAKSGSVSRRDFRDDVKGDSTIGHAGDNAIILHVLDGSRVKFLKCRDELPPWDKSVMN